jgi:hypothetical protein
MSRWPSPAHKGAAYRMAYSPSIVGPPTRIEHEALVFIAEWNYLTLDEVMRTWR